MTSEKRVQTALVDCSLNGCRGGLTESPTAEVARYLLKKDPVKFFAWRCLEIGFGRQIDNCAVPQAEGAQIFRNIPVRCPA